MTTKKFKNEAERKKILDRIRKILNHAEGTQYEAEAQTAMRMAQSYMKQYGLSLSEVQLKEELSQPIGVTPINRKVSNQELWELYVCRAVALVFDCEMVKMPSYNNRGWQAGFIGFETDAQMATQIATALILGAKSSATKAYPGDLFRIRSFLKGFGLGLIARAKFEKDEAKRQQQQQTAATTGYALVVVAKENAISEWVGSNLNIQKTKARRQKYNEDPEAFSRGQHESRNVNLNNHEQLN